MSLAGLIKTDANAEDLLKDSQSHSFAPLPAGWYEFTIKAVEVVDFANSGKYADGGYKALNVQLRILDGSPVGAGRVFFLRVPLFQRFLPTQKNPQGAVASLYFDFFLTMGFTKEEVAAGKVAIDQATLGGKRIGAQLLVKEPDQWHTDKWNDVNRVRAPKALPGVAEPGASAVGSAFQPQVGQESPWGSSAAPAGDSQLQQAAESKGAF